MFFVCLVFEFSELEHGCHTRTFTLFVLFPEMSLLYRSQQLNHLNDTWSESESGRRLDEECIKKFGHPFLKTYEPRDEDRFFLPERSSNGYMVYHRYHHYEGQTTCYVHLCYCSQGGNICLTCRPLNTTTFCDLDVPLDVERFIRMKTILQEECGMSHEQMYNWLSFWIHDIIPKRYDHDVSTPIFFRFMYRNHLVSKTQTPYSFMSFLYDFVNTKCFLKKYREFMYNNKPCFLVVSNDSVQIRSLKALVKWSIDVYSHNQYIIRCETSVKRRRCYSVFWTSGDTRYDRSVRRWKEHFRTCVTQIRDEVAFRPGKVGMCDARQDFEEMKSLLS